MRKLRYLAPAVIAISLCIGSLTGCTPNEARVAALSELRHQGIPESVVARFDCIGYRESRWVANAQGYNPGSGTYDKGVFQINSIHAAKFQQVTGKNYWSASSNPTYNARYAAWLYRQAGLSPWASTSHPC